MGQSGIIIPFASDHGGFEMKEFLKQQLSKDGYVLKDYGTFSDASVDYPDYIHPLASAVNQGMFQLGIIICGSGNGAQMTANKYPNVRAALCWDVEQCILTLQHNNANILSLPGRFINFDLALTMVRAFLSTPFEGGRHQQRIDKISQLINNEYHD